MNEEKHEENMFEEILKSESEKIFKVQWPYNLGFD